MTKNSVPSQDLDETLAPLNDKHYKRMPKNYDRWIQFFESYRNMPELWQTTHWNYNNTSKKSKNYSRLMKEYQQIEESATEELLKRKINKYKTLMNREFANIQKSQSSGCAADQVYVSTKWYFKPLSFLKEKASASKSNSESISEIKELQQLQERVKDKKQKKWIFWKEL